MGAVDNTADQQARDEIQAKADIINDVAYEIEDKWVISPQNTRMRENFKVNIPNLQYMLWFFTEIAHKKIPWGILPILKMSLAIFKTYSA